MKVTAGVRRPTAYGRRWRWCGSSRNIWRRIDHKGHEGTPRKGKTLPRMNADDADQNWKQSNEWKKTCFAEKPKDNRYRRSDEEIFSGMRGGCGCNVIG